ncbi:hypothetical protein H8S20_16780 [Clostridium sp. NSJ-6]|uniref:Uncharacterized protein n=1 Tax=Clostridium hominis TaxID=2763036 RepID=A0ABR7DI43_9CLOT|nr:hypothetical protein [Clostridium hominis]MBC5630513.1 hypothetical protein [Clostridium hominis]
MGIKILTGILISISISFVGFVLCMLGSSIFNPSGLNSYLYVIIFCLCYLSGVISFWSYLILRKLDNKLK